MNHTRETGVAYKTVRDGDAPAKRMQISLTTLDKRQQQHICIVIIIIIIKLADRRTGRNQNLDAFVGLNTGVINVCDQTPQSINRVPIMELRNRTNQHYLLHCRRDITRVYIYYII